MIVAMSEDGGYFPSDNWVTNEISYLEVLDTFKRHKIEGGVYMGVAASQNFSYISKVKPKFAFFVDIRHQNRMQHLVYKILFEISPTRIDFFSNLLSKPLESENRPDPDIPIDDLVAHFYTIPTDAEIRDLNTERIISMLEDKYKFIFDDQDIRAIKYVMDSFYRYNLDIRYSSGARMMFPTFAEVLTARDLNGNMVNAFNSNEEYEFLRTMQVENRIIPLTGNFGGRRAIRSVGNFMKKHNLTLTAYYVSNVEEYVIKDRSLWNSWVDNLRSLPLTDKSVIIRWTHELGLYYQETRLQPVKEFIKLHDEGRYNFYTDLIYTKYLK